MKLWLLRRWVRFAWRYPNIYGAIVRILVIGHMLAKASKLKRNTVEPCQVCIGCPVCIVIREDIGGSR